MSLIEEKRLAGIIEKFSSLKPILVVGDMGLDKYTEGAVNRISPEAPVPVLEVEREYLILGLSSNISNNLKSLGVTSTLVGVVGEDDRASRFENLLEENGLKTWGIVRDHSRPTTYKERITTPTQQLCRIDYESKENLAPQVRTSLQRRVEDLLPEHGSIIIQDYGKGIVERELVESTVSMAKSKGLNVYLDPYRTKSAEIYKGVDLIKPNLVEGKMLVESIGKRTQDPEEICKILSGELEIPKVVLTMGGKGMLLFDSEKNSFLLTPTLATEVFDVSGAGDTVISLLVAAKECGATLEESAWMANCGAGVVVGKKGTATVNADELRDFHGVMTRKLQ